MKLLITCLGVYRLNDGAKRPFLEGVQEVLAVLSSLVEDLNTKAPLRSNDSCGTVSRNAATLHLTYYQVSRRTMNT